jgi:hypothetical protein
MDDVLVVGPGSVRLLASEKTAIANWLKAGGRLLGIGLDQDSADALLPIPIKFAAAEHISTFFEPSGASSWLEGVGPSDVHNRDPRKLPLVASGAGIVGNGVLAVARESGILLCQLVPWQFDPGSQPNLKRTYRRASFLVARLLANLEATGTTPVRMRFNSPVSPASTEKRWLDGLYLDQPAEWDDPYRFFRW